MTPADASAFPESNAVFGPPRGLEESQVRSVAAWSGEAMRGSMEGTPMVVVAYVPDERERATIAAGAPIFVTFCGGLPPHFLSVSFVEASNPA